MLNYENSKRRFWKFYSRYFQQTPIVTFPSVYDGLTAAGGTYVDILDGRNSKYSSFTDQIDGGTSGKGSTQYTGLDAAGGTYSDVLTGETSSTSISYSLAVEGGDSA
jgi:hypothetical protein